MPSVSGDLNTFLSMPPPTTQKSPNGCDVSQRALQNHGWNRAGRSTSTQHSTQQNSSRSRFAKLFTTAPSDANLFYTTILAQLAKVVLTSNWLRQWEWLVRWLVSHSQSQCHVCEWLSQWLTDWLTQWLSDSLTESLTHLLTHSLTHSLTVQYFSLVCLCRTKTASRDWT